MRVLGKIVTACGLLFWLSSAVARYLVHVERTRKMRKLFVILFVSLPSIAFAQELTLHLTPDEAQGIVQALSHEMQIACMLGQCGNASIATVTVPRKITAAEQVARPEPKKIPSK